MIDEKYLLTIYEKAEALRRGFPDALDTLAIDKALGELECAVHDARLEIDIEWREARRRAAPHYPRQTQPTTLDDLI